MPEKIGLQAILDDRQFQAGLKRYLKGIDQAEDETDDMSEAIGKSGKGIDDLGGSMDKGGLKALNLAAQMAIVADSLQIVKELAGKGLELAKLGATAERIEERFAAFSEEAGGATVILEAFQEGAGGAASEMEAMRSASQLLQMGIVTNADEMEEFVTIATRLGDQTQTVTQRTENFALMMANQSLPRLDSYGLSSGRVREKIAELQAATEGLTREEAFSIAVREEAGKALEVLGERTKDTAMSFEIMEARMADAKVELGKKFAPVFGAAIDLLGGLGDEALMAVAAFQEFGSALVQAGPLLNAMLPTFSKLPGAIKAMNLGLKSSALAIGALGIALIALGIAVDKYSKSMEGMRKAEEGAKQAAVESKNVILEQVDAGQRLGDVMLAQADKTNVATKAWNDNIVTGTALSVLVGAQNKILDIYAKKQQAVTEAALATTTSYDGYIEAILIYNDHLTDAAARVDILTEAEWDIAQAAYDATIATEDLGAAVEDVGLGAEDSESRFRHLAQAMQDGTIVTDEAEAAQARLVYELERQKQASENAAAAEEIQTQKLEDLKRAQEDAKTAAFNHAQQLLTLAERLSDLDKGAIARAAIEELGKLHEANIISTPEYTEKVQDLQDAYGLVTKQGRFMADALERIAEVEKDGELGTLDWSDAVEIARLQSVKHILSIEKLETALNLQGAEVEKTAEKTDIAKTSSDELKGATEDILQPTIDAHTEQRELWKAREEAKKPTDELKTSTDDLKTATEESVSPLGDAKVAVDDFAEATLEAQDPVDELLARFELLPDQILTLAPQMRQAGVSLVGAFRVGFEAAFEALEAEKVKRLQEFREEFHASREPKDPTSPLRGFFEAGAALVQTYMEGLESEWPNLGKTLDDMFTFGRAFGGLGGIAAGILNKDVRAMQQATKGIDAELTKIFKSLGVEGRPKGGEETYAAIIAAMGGQSGYLRLIGAEVRGEQLTKDQARRLAIFKSLMPLMRERGELTREQVRLEEKLQAMQEQQTRLRFLEQQVALLELIEKHGLMGEDILDGMRFGADASAEEVLDAMTRAMEEVIKQAEERLGIESPSKVFFKIGQQTMAGMALGIQDLATLPVRQSLIASGAVASAPAMTGGGYVDNSRTVTIQAGGNTITNAAEGAHFESRVKRAVVKGMRGL